MHAVMQSFVDPRARMRTALRVLVEAEPTSWHEPSLAIFRNRLLDETGSDARPLAELLLEAVQRGWHERLPREPLESARWDALAAPFVMLWSAERFIQPEMAQWAAESWAFALGSISADQLRIAPPPRPAPPVAPNGAPRERGGDAGHTRNSGAVTVGFARSGTRAAPVSRAAAGRPATTGTGTRSRYIPNTYSAIPQPDPRLVKGLAIAAVVAYVFFIARMFITVQANKRAEARAATQAAPTTAMAPATTPATTPATAPATTTATTTATTPSAVPSTTAPAAPLVIPPAAPIEAPVQAPVQAPPVPAAAALPDVPTPASDLPRAATNPAARSAGVPGVTSSLLAQRLADPARMLYVEPARRASGNSRAVPTAAAPASLAYDEVVLNDSTTMRGRVEIVRAGTVIFRDLRTGLRHELRKEDIDRIITEFGAPVRFRAAGIAPGARSVADERRRIATGVRSRGVGGRYVVRYAAAQAVGSPECTKVWTRAPNATDLATIRHAPGGDTLVVAFDGGDSFLSNIDPDGYFASTFRIVPDQARTSTALTTRLTGQFLPNGVLALQVNIVFFRRLREGSDITCTVTIKASGTRDASGGSVPR